VAKYQDGDCNKYACKGIKAETRNKKGNEKIDQHFKAYLQERTVTKVSKKLEEELGSINENASPVTSNPTLRGAEEKSL